MSKLKKADYIFPEISHNWYSKKEADRIAKNLRKMIKNSALAGQIKVQVIVQDNIPYTILNSKTEAAYRCVKTGLGLNAYWGDDYEDQMAADDAAVSSVVYDISWNILKTK